MANITRRSLLGGSVTLAAAVLPKPHIANAAATTATVWVASGFIPEEDAAFRKLVADYQKASGNSIDYTIVPFATLPDKVAAAMKSGQAPDLAESTHAQGPEFAALHGWSDELVDVTDVIQTQKPHFDATALLSAYCFNNVTKQRSYYGVPWKVAVTPFHVWRSLVNKAGFKESALPKTWDAFIDFFRPVQDHLRTQGMGNIYAYGYQLTEKGADPAILFSGFLIAYGGQGLVTPDGVLHTDSAKVRNAAVKALEKLTGAYKSGYVPPGTAEWGDVDDNKAFQAKRFVMDFDATISTELALQNDKQIYDDILTLPLPRNNEGEELPSQLLCLIPIIPKSAKNVSVAKDFMKFAIQPEVLSEYLKGGLGRWLPPMPSLARRDAFWLDPSDPHRSGYTQQALFSPTIPVWTAFNPGMAEVADEHVFSVAMFDVIDRGMTPDQAITKAFRRLEAIFDKYPIAKA
jgi:multiple sugar transport system substrate-binding protein